MAKLAPLRATDIAAAETAKANKQALKDTNAAQIKKMAQQQVAAKREASNAEYRNTVASKLNTTPATPKDAAKGAGFLGGIGREALAPSQPNEISRGIQKQLGRARMSNNPYHGLALSKIADELGSRIQAVTYTGSQEASALGAEPYGERASESPERTARLAPAKAHLDAAAAAIKAHQQAHGRGDGVAALEHLSRAADHINDAANSVVERSATTTKQRGVGLRATDSGVDANRILKDTWSPNATPWKDEADPGHRASFSSLENVHQDLKAVVDAYRDHVKDSMGLSESDLHTAPRSYAPGKMSDLAAGIQGTVGRVARSKPEAKAQIKAAGGSTAGLRIAEVNANVNRPYWGNPKQDSDMSAGAAATKLGLLKPNDALSEYKRMVKETAETGSAEERVGGEATGKSYPVIPPVKYGTKQFEKFVAPDSDKARERASISESIDEKNQSGSDAEGRLTDYQNKLWGAGNRFDKDMAARDAAAKAANKPAASRRRGAFDEGQAK